MEGEKLFYQGKYKEAFEIFSKVNDSLSNYFLGYMFENGIFVVKNLEKSIEHYLKGKEEISSLLNLGYIYEQGLVVSVDLEKSIQFYKEAAEKNSSQALNCLGYIYKRQKNFEKSIHFYEKSVDLGNITAMYNLGKLYQHYLKDSKKAAYYYDLGVKKNDLECLYALGMMYYEGNGVKQDFDKALNLFKQGWEDPGSNQMRKEIQKKLGIFDIEEKFENLMINDESDEDIESGEEIKEEEYNEENQENED